MVRIDPARYRFRLLTAKAEGGDRPVTEWLSTFRLTGVTNASMYGHDRRSVGLMVDDDQVNNGSDNDKFGGFIAFGPRDKRAPQVAFFGRSCPGFDLAEVRRKYRTVVQNYRLLDCDGRAIRWKDEKVYSAAAIGQDEKGRVVFIHSRTPYSMTVFASMLASPELEIRHAHYVEGGPEASLHVRSGNTIISEMGSYETAFNADDSNVAFWSIPNVIGFTPKQ
jgi:hypothetical protein